MTPEHTIFPEFVPDQVLTSDHLNDMFEYLDEQGRMTRSNLIGIGIVCGLQIKTVGNTITITKGVGVTSEGYLIRQETDMVYTAYKSYDALKEEYYNKFVNTGVNPKTQKFDLLELKENATETGSNVLSLIPAGLSQYYVLLFVELLHNQNKNCDPNSCDDKGINVAATIRPLLIFNNATNLNSLLGATGNPLNFSPFYTLPQVKMPRYNVPNSFNLPESEDVLKVYVGILNNIFLSKVETTLTLAHSTFSTFLGTTGASPFAGLAGNFNFIANLTTKNQILHLQYYYDIFSDLLLAYDEFRKLGNGILSTCCPNTSLFPRHLLLGEAVPTATMISSYRHYFIYSPLFEKKNLILELRFLFSKMQLMKNHVFIPPFAAAPNKGIRITPSMLSDVPLSQKAIPYYYNPLQLQPSWSFDKTLRSKANQNLSYHAPEYPLVEDFVMTPLKFDLEPYNFLRIEGHIGKQLSEVLLELNLMKASSRLPIDVVALSTGEADLSKITDGTISCNIRDLQTSYEIIRREWEAIIGKMIEYLHDNENGARDLLSEASVGSDIFGDYIVLLHLAKDFMVQDLRIFISRYDDFLIPVYEEIEIQSIQMRNILVDILNNESDLEREKRVLAEDLVDHFDEVSLSCKKGGFRSIFQQFNSRINEIYSTMFFNRFVEKHPGIQHKAGVPMGGTFILVYHKRPASNDLKGPFTITGLAMRTTGQPAFPGVVYVINATTNISASINVNGSFSLVVQTLPAIFKVFSFPVFPFFTPLTGELLVTTPGQVANIQVPSAPVIIEDNTNNVFNSLVNNEVIADFYLPYICSSNCTPIQFVIQETINHGPVANAGTDQTFNLPKNSTILDGSGSSDPENKPLIYSWVLISDQQDAVFSDQAAAQPGVSNLNEPGQYIFELTVEDEGGKTHTDQVIVTVNPEPNLPPVANAGNDQAIQLPASTLTLTGTGTDPENKPLSFSWTLLNGPSLVTFSNANAAQTSVSNLTSVGQYVFQLTVTDEKLLTDTDEVTITVRPAQNLGPIANAGGVLSVALPTTFVQLDGSGSSDPEGRGLSFLWENAGALLRIANKTSPHPIAYDLTQSPTYRIRLTVSDDINQADADEVNIRMEGNRRNDTCMNAKNIIAFFANFIDDDSDTARKFREKFPAFREVEQYFNMLIQVDLPGRPVPEQLEFFLTFELEVNRDGTVSKVGIVEAMIIWLESLFLIIHEPDEKEIRNHAMGLYNILVFLATYIACIQKEDQNRRVDTIELFQLIEQQIASIDQDYIKSFDNQQLMQLMRLRQIVDDEIFVIEITGQSTSKKTYLEILQSIRKMLDELFDF